MITFSRSYFLRARLLLTCRGSNLVLGFEKEKNSTTPSKLLGYRVSDLHNPYAQRFGMFPSLKSLTDLPRLVTVAKPRLVCGDFLSEGSIVTDNTQLLRLNVEGMDYSVVYTKGSFNNVFFQHLFVSSVERTNAMTIVLFSASSHTRTSAVAVSIFH